MVGGCACVCACVRACVRVCVCVLVCACVYVPFLAWAAIGVRDTGSSTCEEPWGNGGFGASEVGHSLEP